MHKAREYTEYIIILVIFSLTACNNSVDSAKSERVTQGSSSDDISQYSSGNIEDPDFNGVAIDEESQAQSYSPLSGIAASSTTCGPIGSGYKGFYANNCTEWVAFRRCEKEDSPVIWHGNAGQWLANAAAVNYETGISPKASAIAVFKLSYDPCSGKDCKNKALYLYGHVAYVESSNSNGEWCISEYNYKTPLAYGERCFSAANKAPALIGFIYGPPSSTSTQPVNPIVSVTPQYGPHNTTFSEPGTGFTPNSSVTLYFKYPDGYQVTITKITDGNGAYTNSWLAGSNAQTGTYQYWAVDDSTKISSNTVSFVVTINPQVTVTPSSGPRGTTFDEPGLGFTPNCTVTLYFQYPDGQQKTLSKNTDGNGAYTNSWPTGSGTQTGTYKYWAIDNNTNKCSNTVSFTITP